MKILAIFALTSLFFTVALSQSQPYCGQNATMKLRGDNFLTTYVVHHGVQGSQNILTQSPDTFQWANTYTSSFSNIQNGDIIRVAVENVGGPGAFKAALTFENGYQVLTQGGSVDFYINCALSSGITGCSTVSITQATYPGYGPDTLPVATQWVWTQAAGNNPNVGVVYFDFPICCVEDPIVSGGNPICSYEYWEFLALGYPWYHRADLDAWCGAYPSVAGVVTNCYNGAQQIAPACTESYPNFSTILAGDGSVDWNLRCFLKCV